MQPKAFDASQFRDATFQELMEALGGNDMLGARIDGDYIVFIDGITQRPIARVHFTDLEMHHDAA